MNIYKGKVLMRGGECRNIQRKSIDEGGSMEIYKGRVLIREESVDIYFGKVLMREGEYGNIQERY